MARRLSFSAGMMACALALLLTGCGGGSSSGGSSTPAISGFSPTATDAGGQNFTLTVNGANFANGAQIFWNGSARATSYGSSNLLYATILTTDLQTAASVPVTVKNPNGNSSAAAYFAVNNPVPVVNSTSPASVNAGAQGFTMTVNGTGFVNGSLVQWNGTNLTTYYTSATVLTAIVPASDLAVAGAGLVTVFNPTPMGGLSNTATLPVNVPLLGYRTIVDVNFKGKQGSGGSLGPSVSSNGRYVAFESYNQNLIISKPPVVNHLDGFADIYVADTCLGADAFCSPKMYLASANPQGLSNEGNGNNEAFLSRTGRFVSYSTLDRFQLTNGRPMLNVPFSNVVLRDTCIGAPAACTPSTVRVSTGPNDEEPNNNSGYGGPFSYGLGSLELDHGGGLAVSDDGRFAVFMSNATNLVPNLDGQYNVYLRDTCIGAAAACTTTTYLVSADPAGNPVGGQLPRITHDGRYVTFVSSSAALPNNPAGIQNAFIRDTCAGVSTPCTPLTFPISVAGDGSPANGASYAAVPDDSTRYFVFASDASNLVVGDTNGTTDIFIRDTCNNGPATCTPRNYRINLTADGREPNGPSYWPAISGNSRYVAFVSEATNLVPSDTNGVRDAFVVDTCFGATNACTPSIERFSGTTGTDQLIVNSPLGAPQRAPAISGDGRWALFDANPVNPLVQGEASGVAAVFRASSGFAFDLPPYVP